MQFAAKLRNQVSSFQQDESGNIFMITAVAVFVFMGSVGAAVDYSRVSNTKSKMEQALDAAVLATGVELLEGETNRDKLRERFDAFFEVNVSGTGNFAEEYRITSFSADPNSGEVNVEARAIMEPTIMRIFGYEEFQVAANSSAVFDQQDVEVAMMLDVTGSMGRNGKIRDLRLAATDAVNILLPNPNTRGVRIGLVPYASSVNAGSFARTVTRNNGDQIAFSGSFGNPGYNITTRDCVTGRGGRHAATDTFYADGAPIGSDRRSVDEDLNDFYRCPSAKIRPLTSNAGTLKGDIRLLRANGYTAGHLGIAWSYYLLSEKWAPLWRTANAEPAPISSGVKKIAILMTDGLFNTAFDGVDGELDPRTGRGGPFNTVDSTTRSNRLSEELCENMKVSGITVYAIGFDLDGIQNRTQREEVTQLLDDCATPDTADNIYFFNAENGQELRDAFQTIASSIQTLRISR